MNVPRVCRAIRAVLADYDSRLQDFTAYRHMIGGEHAEFLAQVTRIFGGRLVPQPMQPRP
jgi:hypothetical protein